MLVSEKNGEVSASVEETNRVRALLGLKPLQGTDKRGPVPPKPAPTVPEPPPARAPGQVEVGPALPAMPLSQAAPAPAEAKQLAASKAAAGKQAVLQLELSRYAKGDVAWR